MIKYPISTYILLALLVPFFSCQGDEPIPSIQTDKSVFILNEGNYSWNNASLSVYDADSMRVQHSVFLTVNQAPLGDVAQSLIFFEDEAFIAINGSNKVYVIDSESYQFKGKITGLTSPRYITILNSSKGYISDLYSNEISVFSPEDYTLTGSISLHHSSEQMLLKDDFLYVLSWSYDSLLFKIDTQSDEVIDSLVVGFQPNSMQLDKDGKLWILYDGGYSGIPGGQKYPGLVRVNPGTFEMEARFSFPDIQSSPIELHLNPEGDILYFIEDDLFAMSIYAAALPASPVISRDLHQVWYAIGVSPVSGDIYMADAVSYAQPGYCYRYSSEYQLLDSFQTGINPGFFAFRPQVD